MRVVETSRTEEPGGLPIHGLSVLGVADAALGSHGEKRPLLERGDELLHLGGLDAATELKHRLNGPNNTIPRLRAELLQSLRHLGRPLGMIHSWGDLRIARHLRRRGRASALELPQRVIFLRCHLNYTLPVVVVPIFFISWKTTQYHLNAPG